MISTRSYLLRAIRDWAIDNDLTPQILVDAARNGVKVPPAYVHDGRITLNVSGRAVSAIDIDPDWVRFGARFGGQHVEIEVPMSAVLAVYARENGHGVVFEEDASSAGEGAQTPSEGKAVAKRPSHLKLVK
jgi:stringent starvation protein B